MNSIAQTPKTIPNARPIPQMQRVWLWLNEHQPQSAKQVALALHLPHAPGLLSQMENRCMVRSTVELDQSTQRHVKKFRVVGREYEYLPLPFTPIAAKPTAQVFELRFQPTDPAEPVQLSQAGPTAFDLDTLTIAEARALYKRLATMFQGEKA